MSDKRNHSNTCTYTQKHLWRKWVYLFRILWIYKLVIIKSSITIWCFSECHLSKGKWSEFDPWRHRPQQFRQVGLFSLNYTLLSFVGLGPFTFITSCNLCCLNFVVLLLKQIRNFWLYSFPMVMRDGLSHLRYLNLLLHILSFKRCLFLKDVRIGIMLNCISAHIVYSIL